MNYGIPDPGRASKAVEIVVHGASPFDAGRIPCPQGGEDRWSARWLMEQLGYDTWENFAAVIERAKTAAHNEGFNAQILFRAVTKKTGGRPQSDFHVTRYAAYLTAMNGSSIKREVSQAQHYFAVRTREAEVAPKHPAVMPTHSEALRGWAAEIEARELAESKVVELTGPASSWNELAEAAGDYSVADAAKVLSRDPKIKTGERRLFADMNAFRWIFRRDGRWRAYQRHVDAGWLTEKVGKPYVRNGEMCVGDPTVRITPKGLAQLHQCLGGSGQLALMAVSE